MKGDANRDSTGDRTGDTLSRRRLLAVAAASATSGLAGCTISTPFGDFGASGDDDGNDDPGTPTAVTTVRPSSSTPTESASTSQAPTTQQPTTQQSTTQQPTTVPEVDTEINTELLDPEIANNFTLAQTDLELALDTDLFEEDNSTAAPTETTESTTDVEVTVTPDRHDVGTQTLSGEQTEQRNDMTCNTASQEATADGGGLLTENLVLNHRLNEIWPGAIIPAKSVANGGYGAALSPDRLPNRQATDVRNPIQVALYIDANRFSNQDPNVSKTVDPPTSAGVEQARVELLSNVQNGTSAAQLSFDIKQIHSQSHLDVNLGVDYNNLATSIDGDFSYSKNTSTNKVLVKVYQVYYLMGLTFPNPDGSFVTDSSVVNRNDLFVSDVSFGRLLLFSAESKHAATDMKASLDATFRGLAGSGSASLDVEHSRVLDETRLKGQAIGGGAADAGQLISDFGEDGLSRIRNYVVDGANYGPDNPGAPIGFTARYLNTQDRANTYMTTEYNARSCQPKTRKFRVKNVELSVWSVGGDGGNNLKVYGDITIYADHPDEASVVLPGNAWSRDRDEQKVLDNDGFHTLAGVEETVEFEIPDGKTWNEYMEDAEIRVRAELREKDAASPDEYQGDTVEKSWQVTDSVDRTPTLVFSESNNEVHVDFEVEPVPLN